MKKVIAILMLALAVLIGGVSADAKTKKSKNRTSTTHKAATNSSYVKFKDNIPTPAYIFDAYFNEKGKTYPNQFIEDLKSKGYEYDENEYDYPGYTLPGVCGIYFWTYNEYELRNVQVIIKVEAPDALGWFVEQTKALRKKDKYLTIAIEGDEIGLEKDFIRKGWK